MVGQNFLMGRVQKREQEGYGNTIHIFLFQQRQQGLHRFRGQVLQDGPGVVNAPPATRSAISEGANGGGLSIDRS